MTQSDWQPASPSPHNVTLLDEQGATGSKLTDILVNDRYKGVQLWFDVTDQPGIDTVQLTLFGLGPLSDAQTILIAGVATTGPIAEILTVYPGIPDVANESVNKILTPRYRIGVTHVGTGAFDYTVSASFYR